MGADTAQGGAGAQNRNPYFIQQQHAEQQAATQAAVQQQNAPLVGTPWDQTNVLPTDYPANDIRGYMYGRDPNAANTAVQLALDTGRGAQTTGENLLGMGLRNSQAAQGRDIYMGNFGQQNAALAGAESYGNQLAGLEAQQGPSGAQAQLQAGNNAAIAGQLMLARSGRGFGGGAAAAGQAQTNLAGLQAQGANNAAMLAAQENAAWRGRQAGNLGAAAGIQQGIGSQFGEQQARNINAYYAGQGANDQAALGWAGLGQQGYFQGVGANFQGQGLQNQVRGMEMQGGQALDDRILRAWAAERGLSIQQAQAAAQQNAALIQGGATVVGGVVGSFGGPGGTAAGATVGNAAGRAVTS